MSHPGMLVHARAFWLPKAGNADDEYEDAYWPLRPTHRSLRTFRAAVADGATETSFSGLWARMLVRAYAHAELDGDRLQSSAEKLGAEWLSSVAGRPLPWYAEEKVRSGAFSSIVGLAVRSGAKGAQRWEAMALGDSCCVQARMGTIVTSFPLADPDDFNNRPRLLSSNRASNVDLNGSIQTVEGEWESGDSFYLMTDALACWFLRASLDGCEPFRLFETLLVPRGSRRFARLVAELRAAGEMRNDDVTLVVVRLAEAPTHDAVANPSGL